MTEPSAVISTRPGRRRKEKAAPRAMKASPSFSNRRGCVARWVGFWGVSVANEDPAESNIQDISVIDLMVRIILLSMAFHSDARAARQAHHLSSSPASCVTMDCREEGLPGESAPRPMLDISYSQYDHSIAESGSEGSSMRP